MVESCIICTKRAFAHFGQGQCIPIILMFHVIDIQHETLKHYSEFEPKNRILDSIVIVKTVSVWVSIFIIKIIKILKSR